MDLLNEYDSSTYKRGEINGDPAELRLGERGFLGDAANSNE